MKIGNFASVAVLLALGTVGSVVNCSSDEPAPQVAASCQINTDCHNPLSCTFGRCHTQCAETRDCPNPQRCVKGQTAGVCQLEDEVKCVRDSECKEPLICATDSQCRNACAADRDCLAKQVCAAGGVCANLYEVTSDKRLIGDDGGGAAGAGGAGGAAAAARSAGGGGNGGSGDSGAAPDASSGGAGGAGGTPTDGSTSSDVKDATVAETASEAGPTGPKLYILGSSTLFVYTLDQLTVDNTGPEPWYRVTNFGVFTFTIDLDGNAWGLAGSGWVARHLAADLAKSGAAPAAALLKQYVRSSNGQRLGVDGSGNVWSAGGGAGTVLNRLNRATLGVAAVAGDIVGITSNLSVGYTATDGQAPHGIWFDGEGTLVLAEGSTIKRYLSTVLTGTGAQNDPPATTLSLSGTAVTGTDTALASNGDMWFLCGATKVLCRLAKATIVAGGAASAPTGTLTVANFVPVGLAFDKDDNLWAISTSKLIRLPKADLQPTGDVTSVPVVKLNPPAGFAGTFGEIVIPH